MIHPWYLGYEWVVVTRKVGDTTSRGLIVSYHKRRYLAVQEAEHWREVKPELHAWPMRRADY